MHCRLRNAVVFFAAIAAAGVLGCHKKSSSSPVEPEPVCAVTISPADRAFSSDGGTGTVTVATSATSCAWSATPGAAWIAILENATGTGPGTVKYNVAANTASEARSGALTVGGQVHAITQQGRTPTTCTYQILPTNASFGSDGGSGSFGVTAPANCAWTATSAAAWLRVTGGAQGSGNGTVSYSVDRNTDTADRGATILVADKTFAVKQSGESPPVLCEYSVAPVQFNPCMPNGTVTTTITTQASCPWTARPNASWLTVPSGESGTGPGQIVIGFSANYDAPREGIVEVRWPTPTAGQNVRVSQAGCRYAVSRNAFSFAATGGAGSFDVFQQSDPTSCGGPLQDACMWTAVSDVPWITITSSMPRFGDNPVSFTVAPNDHSTSRTGTIAVRDKVVQITQAGR